MSITTQGWWLQSLGRRSEVKLTKFIFDHKSRIMTKVDTNMDNWWSHDEICYPKGLRLYSLWHHNILQKRFWLLHNATAQEQRLDLCAEANNYDVAHDTFHVRPNLLHLGYLDIDNAEDKNDPKNHEGLACYTGWLCFPQHSQLWLTSSISSPSGAPPGVRQF